MTYNIQRQIQIDRDDAYVKGKSPLYSLLSSLYSFIVSKITPESNVDEEGYLCDPEVYYLLKRYIIVLRRELEEGLSHLEDEEEKQKLINKYIIKMDIVKGYYPREMTMPEIVDFLKNKLQEMNPSSEEDYNAFYNACYDTLWAQKNFKKFIRDYFNEYISKKIN